MGMTQEDKQLLIKDLCMRLPYGVKVQVTQVPIGLSKDETLTFNRMYSLEESDKYITVKPYLRPIKSMTIEEFAQYSYMVEKDKTNFGSPLTTDWLLYHHFDYRDLIPKGLAIEAPEGIYRLEEQQ